MLTLSIAKPCQEKWEDMTPDERGAYCKSCCKNVVDFTGMTDEKIFDYFEEKKGEQVCGRFRNDQLNRPLIEISPSIFTLEIPFWKKFLAALFIYFSAFITGCSSNSEMDYTEIEVPASVNIVDRTIPVNSENVTKIDSFPNLCSHIAGYTTVVSSQPQLDLSGTLFPDLKRSK